MGYQACGNRNKGAGPPTWPTGSPQCHDVTQRMLQRVTIVAYRDTAEYTLYPIITLPKFLKIHSLPKVLARISNVWVDMWDIMQIICNSLKIPLFVRSNTMSGFFCWTYSAVSHGWLRRQVRDIITNLFSYRISTPTVNLFKLSLFFSLAFKLPNLIIQSGYLINYHQYLKFTN